MISVILVEMIVLNGEGDRSVITLMKGLALDHGGEATHCGIGLGTLVDVLGGGGVATAYVLIADDGCTLHQVEGRKGDIVEMGGGPTPTVQWGSRPRSRPLNNDFLIGCN